MRARIVISAALVGSLALLAAASPAVANEANGLSDSEGITAGASDGGDGSTALDRPRERFRRRWSRCRCARRVTGPRARSTTAPCLTTS